MDIKGLCQCGCGGKTRLYRNNYRKFIYHHFKHTPESREKLSRSKRESGFIPPSRLGCKHSEESRRRISESGKGLKRSEETKRKISLSLIGRKRKPLSEERKKEISKQMKGRFVSEYTKKLKSERFKGVNNPQWRGGVTPIHWRIRQSLEYRTWRKSVFERDNYTCVFCHEKSSGKLEADHIKRFSLYPELRFNISNGRTLCKDCHKKTDTYGTTGLTRKDYEIWHLQ